MERARALALAACRAWQVDGDDLVLVMVEILTNAFKHAVLSPDGRVLVRIYWRKHSAEIVLDVVVPQTRFELPESVDLDWEEESGRGLTIVRNLARTFSCEEHAPGHLTFTAVVEAA